MAAKKQKKIPSKKKPIPSKKKKTPPAKTAKTAKAKKKTAAPARKAATKKKIVKKAAPQRAPKKAAPKPKAKKVPEPHGLPEILRDAALKILDERQGEDIVTVNLKGRSAMADYAVVATGRSARQLAAIADYLRQAFFKAGSAQVRVEGLPQGDWVLIDAGDILVHLFRPEVRDYYRLEEIWSIRP